MLRQLLRTTHYLGPPPPPRTPLWHQPALDVSLWVVPDLIFHSEKAYTCFGGFPMGQDYGLGQCCHTQAASQGKLLTG